MKLKAALSMAAVVVVLGPLVSAPTFAQTPAGPTQHGISKEPMYDTMKEMSQAMAAMTEQMSGGELTPDRRQAMARNMEHMSSMMRRMSGFVSRPSMMGDPQSRAEMDQMKKEMDEMWHDPSMRRR